MSGTGFHDVLRIATGTGTTEEVESLAWPNPTGLPLIIEHLRGIQKNTATQVGLLEQECSSPPLQTTPCRPPGISPPMGLGSTALKAVTGNPHATLKDVLGKPFMHEGRSIVAIYHPSVPGHVRHDFPQFALTGVQSDSTSAVLQATARS